MLAFPPFSVETIRLDAHSVHASGQHLLPCYAPPIGPGLFALFEFTYENPIYNHLDSEIEVYCMKQDIAFMHIEFEFKLEFAPQISQSPH